MQVQELVGIVPWNFIATICNLFIQVYLIKRFLFKPINEMLEKRKAKADAQIQDAVKAKEEAQAMKVEYEKNMQEAKNRANDIVMTAQTDIPYQQEDSKNQQYNNDDPGINSKIFKNATHITVTPNQWIRKDL